MSYSKVRKFVMSWSSFLKVIPGSLLKPSFPQPGLKHASRASITAKDIALATAAVVSRSVPSAVAGVVFLSGNVFLLCELIWEH